MRQSKRLRGLLEERRVRKDGSLRRPLRVGDAEGILLREKGKG
jgi:hypothetical protein